MYLILKSPTNWVKTEHTNERVYSYSWFKYMKVSVFGALGIGNMTLTISHGPNLQEPYSSIMKIGSFIALIKVENVFITLYC